MMENYASDKRFGTHTVKVTLQRGNHKGHLTYTVEGINSGFSSLGDFGGGIIDAEVEGNLQSDCNFHVDESETQFFVALENSQGEKIGVQDGIWEIEKYIVAVEITDFVSREG